LAWQAEAGPFVTAECIQKAQTHRRTILSLSRISSSVCVFVGGRGRRAVVGTGTGMRQFNQKVERLKAASAAAALDTQIFWSVCVCVCEKVNI